MADDWQPKAAAVMVKLLEEKLGPDIAADTERYAPVGPSREYDPAHPRTPAHEGGELAGSVSFHMNGSTLIVRADAPYAAAVEMGSRPHPIIASGPWSLWSPEEGYLGHAVMHPGAKPQSFMRKALYQERGE